MNYRQTLFLTEYLLTGNATKSAEKAGYSPETAYSQGQRLLRNVEIKAAIESHIATIMKETQVTIESVVKRINDLADRGNTDSDRLRALDMLMKHLGGYITEKDIINALTPEQLEQIAQKLLTQTKDGQAR